MVTVRRADLVVEHPSEPVSRNSQPQNLPQDSPVGRMTTELRRLILKIAPAAQLARPADEIAVGRKVIVPHEEQHPPDRTGVGIKRTFQYFALKTSAVDPMALTIKLPKRFR